MVGLQIGAKPDAGFEDPIGMLIDCHRRVESFLHVLCLVAERGRGKCLTEEEAAAVNAALNYFRSGGKRHTADEEESLFPRLRGTANRSALDELDRLEGDHERANELHETVEILFLKWIESGWLVKDDEKVLLDATAELECIYQVHIKVEEEVVFPQASQALDREAVAAMGQEFRARRA